MDLLLQPLKKRYTEDHTHMTNALVRDEENSREGYIAFKPGPNKTRDEKDVPYPYLKAIRAITQFGVKARLRVDNGIILNDFNTCFDSSVKVEGGTHYFKMSEKVVT